MDPFEASLTGTRLVQMGFPGTSLTEASHSLSDLSPSSLCGDDAMLL